MIDWLFRFQHHIGSISVIYISNILNEFMVNMSRFDSEIYAYDLYVILIYRKYGTIEIPAGIKIPPCLMAMSISCNPSPAMMTSKHDWNILTGEVKKHKKNQSANLTDEDIFPIVTQWDIISFFIYIIKLIYLLILVLSIFLLWKCWMFLLREVIYM